MKPTRPTNADLVFSSTSILPTEATQSARYAIENVIKQSLQGHPASPGALFEARVKAQSHVFRITSVEYDDLFPDGSVLGLVNEATEVEISLPTATPRVARQ
ncbi:hypothetical protein BG004_006240, partial [Podila humilis]